MSWFLVKLQIVGCTFYRSPDITDPEYLDQLNSSLKRTMAYKNSHVLTGGDFNCGDIDWNKLYVPMEMSRRQVQSRLVDIVQEHCLSQVIDIPTRQEMTLDILLTNNPTLVIRVKSMPPIGRADHDIVLVEYDIKAKRVLQSPRKVFLYKRADTQGLKDHMRAFADRFMSQDFTRINVNDMWIEFKTAFLKAVDKFISSKMTKRKLGYQWIHARIRALVRKRKKMHHKARRSTDDSLTSRYKRLRAYV